MRSLILLVCLLFASPVLAQTPPPIPIASNDLALEQLGAPLGVKQYKVLSLVGDAAGGWSQLMTWSDRPNLYSPRTLHVRSLNLQTGEVTASLDLPGVYEVWSTLRTRNEDRAYLGTNAGPGLLVYDRLTDTLTNLGNPFLGGVSVGVYSLDEMPDGKIAMGAVGKDVSVYDPAENAFTRYGIVDPSFAYTYVYYIDGQADFIYAALRGATWRVVAINRATSVVTTVFETPDLVVGMYNACLGVRNAQNVGRYYKLEGGVAIGPQTTTCNPNPPPRVVPLVQIDDTVAQQLTWYWQFPGSVLWHFEVIAVGEDPLIVSRLIAWDANNILGASSSYGPMFKYEIAANTLTVQGMPNPGMNVYTMARMGDKAYLGGYPSAVLSSENPLAAFTSPKSFPGRPGVPDTSPASNPRLIAYVANALGLSTQDLIAISVGADGKLWGISNGYRYSDAFFLISYDPLAGTLARWNDSGAFYGYEISWIAERSGVMAITTRVASPPLPNGPTEAALFLFDTKTQTMRKLTPFPGQQTLAAVEWVSPVHLLGMTNSTVVVNNVTSYYTRVYIYDTYMGKVSASFEYKGQLGTLPGTNGAPRKGITWALGPDGMLYGSYKLNSIVPNTNGQYYNQLVRLDPKTQALTAVGRIGVASDFTPLLWVGNDLYIGGAPQLRRVRPL